MPWPSYMRTQRLSVAQFDLSQELRRNRTVTGESAGTPKLCGCHRAIPRSKSVGFLAEQRPCSGKILKTVEWPYPFNTVLRASTALLNRVQRLSIQRIEITVSRSIG